jgi:hypothetical protein
MDSHAAPAQAVRQRVSQSPKQRGRTGRKPGSRRA